jgi:hypothetical protein
MRLQMSKESRAELLTVTVSTYAKASKKERTAIVDSFTASTGYSRKHAIKLLQNSPKKASVRGKGRSRKLEQEGMDALKLVWQTSNRICGKRLVTFLPEAVENLEQCGHLKISKKARDQLLAISAATIDRVLKGEREKVPRSLSHTKRACLVKSKVPIRTFAEWNNVVPGFFEIDTVAHSSSDPNGPFLSTLNMTDIATCWTIPVTIRRKTALDVISALEKVKKNLPFPLLGLDFDNGREFLNEDVVSWCEKQKYTCTRSREYKKNDQCHIEQKNRTAVRNFVGRERYSGTKSMRILRELYEVLALYFNFFQPCQKLLEKKRNGAKSYKKHDKAKTPYTRVLENSNVSQEDKAALMAQRAELDMLGLFNKLQELQRKLKELAIDVPNPVLAAVLAQRNATYKFITRSQGTQKPAAGVTDALKKSFLEAGPGTVVQAKYLPEEYSRSARDSCLVRLAKEGLLKRISWGVYEIQAQTGEVTCAT